MTCIAFPTYKKINPSSQIIIDGECKEGCITETTLYAYIVSFSTDSNQNSKIAWQRITETTNLILGNIFMLNFNET